MSLEIALQENTAAIRELIAKLSAGATIAPDQVEAKKSAPASPPSGAAPQTTDQQADAQEQTGEPLEYDAVKGPFLHLIKEKGRDAGTSLLKEFGLSKLPEAKPEQYAQILAKITAQLATAEA